MLLLNAKQKRQMVGIVFLMLIGGVLEAVGIAAIAPALEIMLDEKQIQKKAYLSFIYNSLGLDSFLDSYDISFCY